MKMFVNLPVSDLGRSQAFFESLGFTFFGMTSDMASVVINDDTQVMLLSEPVFASFTSRQTASPATGAQMILALGVETREQVDELVDKAIAAGGAAAGPARDQDGRYQRGFLDLDGYHWEPLCLVPPAAG
jgi:predicted lactoylglutathione lyase